MLRFGYVTPEQLLRILSAVKASEGVVADEVQRFSLYDERGVSLKDSWETIIADATKRLGGKSDSRCRITVTDRFGGRGHDYQVMDKLSLKNGGMFVIATSVPDEREWIQWRGRTARQDRPGQFHVVLNRQVCMHCMHVHACMRARVCMYTSMCTGACASR